VPSASALADPVSPKVAAIVPELSDTETLAAVVSEPEPLTPPETAIVLTNIAAASIESASTATIDTPAERVGDIMVSDETILEPLNMEVVEATPPLKSPTRPLIEAVPLPAMDEPRVVAIDPMPDREAAETGSSVQWLGSRVLMEVTASILNVRLEPLADSPVLIKLATGARVWAYPGQTGGQWMAVKVEGETGYASARFLAEVDLP
jgi:hypothetical protein